MGKQERRAYLEAIRARYRRSKKAGKAAKLSEFTAVYGLNPLRLRRVQHELRLRLIVQHLLTVKPGEGDAAF